MSTVEIESQSAFAAQDAIDYGQICDLIADASTTVLKQVQRDLFIQIADYPPTKPLPDECFANRLQESMPMFREFDQQVRCEK